MTKVYLFILALLIGTVVVPAFGAPTPAGTTIRNQATATYRTADNQVQTVTSNLVETIIEQVPGLTLEVEQSRQSLPDKTVYFSHRITNSGNGDDRYNLQFSNTGSDDFNLSNLSIYADSNSDGIPDNNTALTLTPWLTAGSRFNVILAATTPATATPGQIAQVDFLVQSSFNGSVTQLNTNTILIDDGAIVELNKSISTTAGPSPSGPYLISLNYKNIGAIPATNLTLIDSLPSGMTYIPGTASWSEYGSVLTDQDPSDFQGSGAALIQYCAYDGSCTGLPESSEDPDSLSTNQITAIINSVPPGESGTLTFEVEIDPQLDAGSIYNTAEFEFQNGGSTTPRYKSNTTDFRVLTTEGVVANGSIVTAINGMNEPVYQQSVTQGGIVYFDNIIWNTGNTTDIFNIYVDNVNSSFPAGTLFEHLQSDRATPMLDNNADNAVDTGPVDSGEFATVVLKLTLPPGIAGNNSGSGFDITKTAVSTTNANIIDSVTDHLDEIIANQVDLTNQAPAGSPGALGSGPGPEPLPVSSFSTDTTGQARFDLYVRHQGSGPDSYWMNAYSTPTGAALPAGWSVVFRDAQTTVPLNNTGSLPSGDSRHIIATIETPLDATPGTYSIYFEAKSPLTGATDSKHDAVIISEENGLSLTPNLSAQLEPGGSVVYRHIIGNTGNTALADIALGITNSKSGWTTVLYEDSDQSDGLSAADQAISGLIALQPGENKILFAKVFAPASAPTLEINETVISASSTSTQNTVSIIDLSTVNRSHVAIRKEQVSDAGCDGQPDPNQDFGPGQIEVEPGNNCIIYRLTATNHGAEPSYNVTIHDYTPPFTAYSASASCSRTPCWITEPATSDTGLIKAETDQLLPGDGFFLQFSVSVE